MRAIEIYQGSDGDATRKFYADLELAGAIGVVAVNLFRACKCSERAKKYRGGIRGKGSYKRMAYDRKNWSLENLCAVLSEHAESIGVQWGWKSDPATPGYENVLYVDLPNGQASFHSHARLSGPTYAGEWDRSHRSAERIVEFCDSVIQGAPAVSTPRR